MTRTTQHGTRHLSVAGGRWPGASVALVLALLLAMAGCAATDTDDAASYDTITFGAAISLTGKTFKEGESVRDGYQLWIDAVNARGGLQVGGHSYRVALRYYDDESRPERTAQLMAKLITEDKVNFLLGPYASDPTAAAAAVAEQYRIPMVEGSGAAESIFANGYKYTFGVLSPARQYLRGIIDLVLTKDPAARTVAFLGDDELFSREVVQGAAEYAVARGMRVVYQAFYPSETQDVSALLAEIKARKPDLLLGAGHLQDSLLIVRQARDLGVAPKAMGFSVGPSSPQFREHLREDADYIYGATQWTSALKYAGEDLWGTPAAYAAAFKAKYPSYKEVPYQAAQSTAALVVYQRALELVGRLDPAAVRDVLATLDMMTFFGRIKFDERGINIYKPMAVEQLQTDGRKYTVFPIEVAEREAQYPMSAGRRSGL